jgi:hypothetical protein
MATWCVGPWSQFPGPQNPASMLVIIFRSGIFMIGGWVIMGVIPGGPAHFSSTLSPSTFSSF